MRRPVVIAVHIATAMLAAAGCSSGDDHGLPGHLGRAPSASGESGGAPSGAASSNPSDDPSATPSAAPQKGSAKVVATLTTKLDSPWGMAPLPAGDVLISSRDTGEIVRIAAKGGKKTTVGSVPGVAADGEGGLLGLALSPDFGADHMVYAYFTTQSDNRIARMYYDERKPAGQQLGAPNTIFKGIPKGSIHNGGRIAFGPDGMLFAGTGETNQRGLAQDEESLGGKILRMTPDGQPAHGNPDADSVVYTRGHRNVQGLTWDDDRRLWATEFGQDTWDELNLIKPGGNYGWPQTEGKESKKTDQGFRDPVEQWHTADASPSGVAYAKGSLWMASLRGERLWRVPLRGAKPVAKPQAFLKGDYGRLRTVLATDDGDLWLTTSNTDGRGDPKGSDDRLLRVRIS